MKTINRGILFFLLVSVMSLQGAGAVITTLDQMDSGAVSLSAAWLESGGTTYLAWGGGGFPILDITVFTFDGSTLTTLTGVDLGIGLVNGVDWVQSGGTDFLVAVGTTAASTGFVNVYSFDGSTLTPVDSVTVGTDGIDVEWLKAANGSIFLAVAAFGTTDEIEVYSFDGSSLTLLDGANYTNGGFGVAWLQAADGTIYLATGGADTTEGDLRIFTFDGTSLSLITGISFGSGTDQGREVSLLQTPDGSIFLAATGRRPSGTNAVLRIYSFNGSTLTQVASDQIGSEGFAVEWFQTGGLNFLAVGVPGPPEYKVYSFISPTLSLLASGTIGGEDGRGIDWLLMNNRLLLGAASAVRDFDGRVGVMEVCIAPIANNDNALILPDTPSVILNVVANDTLFCSSLVDTLVTPPTNGMAVVNSLAGNVTYTPDPGFFGLDSFVYELCDQFSQCDQATGEIIVVEPGSELQLGPNVRLDIYPAAVLEVLSGLVVN